MQSSQTIRPSDIRIRSVFQKQLQVEDLKQLSASELEALMAFAREFNSLSRRQHALYAPPQIRESPHGCPRS